VIDPFLNLEEMAASSASLDQISKDLDDAVERLDAAEAAWEVVYDQTAEALKTQMELDERKGDPAEHWIIATTRREHRAIYEEWRRAKRQRDKLDAKLKAAAESLRGRQSVNKALGEEVTWSNYQQYQHAPDTFGSRAA